MTTGTLVVVESPDIASAVGPVTKTFFNPAQTSSYITLSGANLTATLTGPPPVTGTIAVTEAADIAAMTDAVVSAAKSLVLSGAANSYINRAWTANPTDGKKVTIAFFFKFVGATPPSAGYMYDAGANGGFYSWIQSNDIYDNRIIFTVNGSSDTKSNEHVTDLAWHHLTLSLDSTQATAGNRQKMYLDGVEVGYADHSVVAQNADFHLTENAATAYIGIIFFNPTVSIDAKFAHYYLIDGQALPPSSFTTGTGAGAIHPAAYAGTFGANGFYLNFGDDTDDQSGNGNNWTQNNSPTFSTDLPS